MLFAKYRVVPSELFLRAVYRAPLCVLRGYD
jgi:hypothetical protein